MRLMNRETNPQGPRYEDEEGHPEAERPEFTANANEYSEQLWDLVNSCVAFEPKDRPTMRDLRKEILRLTDPDADLDLAEGMRSQPHEDTSAKTLVYWQEQEQYKIGFSRKPNSGVSI